MHILAVLAHPARPSLTRSGASAIVDSGAALGHTVELADLMAEGFDPVFGPIDHAAFTASDPTGMTSRHQSRPPPAPEDPVTAPAVSVPAS